MMLIHEVKELATKVAIARSAGQRIGFVPTMGALHQGHLSLIEIAKQNCDFVVVSVFVNPLQFGQGEDFEKYPRSIGQDARLLTDTGVDILFAPSAGAVYPKDHPVPQVSAGELGEVFEGKSRPGHFDGMLTVVNRLFDLVRPDVVVFGQKDAQQVALVKQMLDQQIKSGSREPIRLLIGQTIRDSAGLALSSRNKNLSSAELVIAQSIPRALFAGASSGFEVASILEAARAQLHPEAKLDYLELVEATSFLPVTQIGSSPVRLIIAAKVGETRLIDNVLIDRKS